MKNITKQKCIKINPKIFEPLRLKKYLETRSITSLLYKTLDNIDDIPLQTIERLTTKLNYDMNVIVNSRKSYTIYSSSIDLTNKISEKIELIKLKYNLNLTSIALLETSILYEMERLSAN